MSQWAQWSEHQSTKVIKLATGAFLNIFNIRQYFSMFIFLVINGFLLFYRIWARLALNTILYYKKNQYLRGADKLESYIGLFKERGHLQILQYFSSKIGPTSLKWTVLRGASGGMTGYFFEIQFCHILIPFLSDFLLASI